MKPKTVKKTLIAASLVAAFGAAGSAQAIQGIVFDPSGSVGSAGFGISIMNWVLTQALAQNAFPADGAAQTGAFLLGQGRLSSDYSLGSDNLTNVSLTQFTYQFRVPVNSDVVAGGAGVNGAGSLASWTNRATPNFGTDNYFRIFYDPTSNISQAGGTGYGTSELEVNADGNQTLIFEGKARASESAGSNFAITNAGPLAIGTVGTLTQGGNTIMTVGGSGSINLIIEHCDANDLTDASNIFCNASLGGSGVVGTLNTNFFESNIEGLTIDLDLGNGIQTPFGTGVPVPRLVNNNTPNFGGVTAGPVVTNNFTCEGGPTPCDMLYQGQNAVSNFFGEFAPEPGSLALLGLGLGSLGMFVRRRKPTLA